MKHLETDEPLDPPNLSEESHSRDLNFKYDIQSEETKQALLKRPRFPVKARLLLIFLTFFLLSALISTTAMYMLSKINIRVQYVFITNKITNEIQEARRYEKNYFLYDLDLSNVLQHIDKASILLNQASVEFGHAVGTKEINDIRQKITKYRKLIEEIIEKEVNPEFKTSNRYIEISNSLRDYGSGILEIAFDISEKEGQLITSTVKTANRIQIAFLIILLPLSLFLALNITRHIIRRLNRLMDVTQKFASGDFSPVTPTRKTMDEFTHLAIALNNMMYEIEKRQHLLVESHKLRAVGNLTAGVAHELNNPLNNIILTAEMLKESYNELCEEECMDMVNDLVAQGERAHKVVKNLLDFARESEQKSEYLYIDKLIEETISLAKNQIKISKIKLQTNFQKNLEPFYGDRNLLIQVFLNIFINAIDAMKNGGKLSINVSKDQRTGFLSIQISDTGCGIPGHLLGSIFNPFFTTKPTSKGTGLGLSVSKGIIEKHGGVIEVESKVNEGTMFTVHLPIVSIPADIKRNYKLENQNSGS